MDDAAAVPPDLADSADGGGGSGAGVGPDRPVHRLSRRRRAIDGALLTVGWLLIIVVPLSCAVYSTFAFRTAYYNKQGLKRANEALAQICVVQREGRAGLLRISPKIAEASALASGEALVTAAAAGANPPTPERIAAYRADLIERVRAEVDAILAGEPDLRPITCTDQGPVPPEPPPPPTVPFNPGG